MKVKVTDYDGRVLEIRETTPLGFRDMLRHPNVKDYGWRGFGSCWFEIINK